MTDPTSYAAGIEDAARVAQSRVVVLDRPWIKEGTRTADTEHYCSMREAQDIATMIRALAPERGGGAEPCGDAARYDRGECGFPKCDCATLSPAPPAASGWRDQAQAILKRAWVCAHQLPGKDGEGEILLRLKSSADAYAVLDLLTAIWRDEPFPAPPSPVPAQAESGDVDLRTRIGFALWGEIGGTDKRCLEIADALIASDGPVAPLLARIREMEGENARLEARLQSAKERIDLSAAEIGRHGAILGEERERADRLTRAAETARDALDDFSDLADDLTPDAGEHEPLRHCHAVHYLTVGHLRRAREASATLSAALGGKE
jgi:hypothetical protein